MKRFLLVLAAICAALMANASATYVDRELMVKFKSGNVTALPQGASVVKSWPQLKVQLVRLSASMPVAQGLQFFRNRSDVIYVERNIRRQWTKNVNDPMFGQQYALQKIKANQAWDLSIGLNTVVVAVLDSGFELNHPDMVGKFTAGYDFIDNDNDPTWVTEPHGVETAGCVAAATNNAFGVAAIGYNCKVMPIRVGDYFIPLDAAVSGILYAADKGAKVLNMSFGGPGASQTEKDATDYAWNKGCVLVASAGNSGNTDVNYPAGFPHCIPVAATDQNDQKANFSTYGNWVTVAAPGVQVLTTGPNGGFTTADGTSFSGPITAGIAALCIAYAPPSTTNTVIRAAIENNCDPVGNFITKGRVNAFKALNSLTPLVGPGITADPTSITTYLGTYLTGDAASASASDDLYYQIASSGVPQMGQVASALATFTVPTDITQMTIKIEAVSGVAGGTNTFWLWDWTSGQFRLIGSTPLNASGNAARQYNVRSTDVLRYVGPAGEVQLVVRGILPVRPFNYQVPNPFVYQIDQIQLQMR